MYTEGLSVNPVTVLVQNLPEKPGVQEQLMLPLTILHKPPFLHGLFAHKDIDLQLGYSPANSGLHTQPAPFIGSKFIRVKWVYNEKSGGQLALKTFGHSAAIYHVAVTLLTIFHFAIFAKVPR